MGYYKAGKIFKESFHFLTFLTLISMITGSAICFGNIALLLLVYPAFVNAAGGLIAIIASKMNTRIHLYGLERSFSLDDVISGLVISLIYPLILSLIIPFFIPKLAGYELFLILWLLFCSILTFLILLPIAIFVSVFAAKKGLDPDNLSAPVLTHCADLIGGVLLALTTNLFIPIS